MKTQQEVERMLEELQTAIDAGKRLNISHHPAIDNLEAFTGILRWVLEVEQE